MDRVAFVTDSTSDLPPEVLAAHDIAVVPLNLHIDDHTFRDQLDISTEEFHARLVATETLPTTSQPGVSAFRDAFRLLAPTHDSIVAILVSSKLSDTVESATTAAEEVATEIPVEIVDSFNVSLGLGFQVLHAKELGSAGLDSAEIALRLRANVDSYQLVFFVDTLDYLKRGGRIGTAATLAGSLLKLKPVLHIDEGQIVPFERARTKAKAIAALDRFARSWPAVNRLGVLYSSDRAGAEQLLDSLAVEVPADRVVISQIGPVLSAHLGPDVMGVCVDVGALT
jgi:DegV family protein with EDD domain